MSGASTERKRPPDDDVLDIPRAKSQRVREDGRTTEATEPSMGIGDGANVALSAPESTGQVTVEALIPPSRALLGDIAKASEVSSAGHIQELDVGISEYVSKDLPSIHAIIKQR